MSDLCIVLMTILKQQSDGVLIETTYLHVNITRPYFFFFYTQIKKLCNSTEPCVWSLRLSTDKSENTIMWNFITSLASLALNVKSETSGE